MKSRRILRTAVLAFALGSLATTASAADTIRIVTDPTFPPMEFSKDGKRTGFDIELTEALARPPCEGDSDARLPERGQQMPRLDDAGADEHERAGRAHPPTSLPAAHLLAGRRPA